ncbi:YeeE/YedE thiosulfate transporter family protein [Roseomonas sp. HF4]|uniref:YeeE/YedE thiosulfate transporter family protein n=1 Tax=Roseomonas sp. HF4 TaxID=2562313 RepID=UPI0010BF70E9|nr:YeeE/YedE thiosulfate transporter family protein [Roseomonas sp. HF4]
MAGSLARPAPRAHPAGLALGLAGLVTLAVAAMRLEDPALLPVLAVSAALGAAFVLLDYGFTGGFRAFLEERDGRVLGAAFVVPAVAALVVLPVGATMPGYGRFVAPVGPSLVVGAAVFGVGMMLANGCGSGALVAAGQGARRMFVALPFFCLGGVLGSLLLPAALRLPGVEVDLAAPFGPWTGLLAVEALLLAMALAVLRGARPAPAKVLPGVVIGLLAALLFLVSGMPWGITMGLTLWGAKAGQAVGIDLTGTEFWAEGWTRAALDGPVLAMHGVLGDAGIVAGALAAAAATGRLRHMAPIGWRGALGGALGGLLMGVGARLSFGCNVGAFLGGASSGSLHGFAWILAVLPGCWLGLRLRPAFALPARPG